MPFNYYACDFMTFERVKTGIEGFDELIEGGIPQGNTVLVVGTPGTGKTIFGLEYLYNGVTKFNERGLFISLEQTEESLIEQAKQFGWDIAPLIKEKSLQFKYITTSELNPKTSEMIIQYVRKQKIKRMVIDSITTLAINAPIYAILKDNSMIDIYEGRSFFSQAILGDFVVKRFVYDFINSLNNRNKECTTLLISEAPERGDYISRDTVSEFAADGVILITFESMGGAFSRSLLVRKLRNTKNDEDIHPLEITNKGLTVHNINK